MNRKLTGKPIIIFGAGLYGRQALYYFGKDRVYCFADNFKYGQEFMGKPVISFEKLRDIALGYDIIVAINAFGSKEVFAQLINADIKASAFGEHIDIDNLETNHEIAKFHNIHKGKRCFLIGNGPSLRSGDLDKLYANDEITFGCNFIYKIFPQTSWRPNYYVVSDPFLFNSCIKEIADVEADVKFFPKLEMITVDNEKAIQEILDTCKGRYYFFFPDMHSNKYFSNDPSKIIVSFGTVMYVMMQLAAYMGFEEIYLVGVDATTKVFSAEDYYGEKVHFYEEPDLQTMKNMMSLFSMSKPDDINSRHVDVYSCAENYSQVHDFRIYNATRGGKLEIFERVNFDALF